MSCAHQLVLGAPLTSRTVASSPGCCSSSTAVGTQYDGLLCCTAMSGSMGVVAVGSGQPLVCGVVTQLVAGEEQQFGWRTSFWRQQASWLCLRSFATLCRYASSTVGAVTVPCCPVSGRNTGVCAYALCCCAACRLLGLVARSFVVPAGLALGTLLVFESAVLL